MFKDQGNNDAPPSYPAPGHLPSQGQGTPSNQDYYGDQQPQTSQQYGQYASGAPQSQQFGMPPQNQPYGAPPPLQQQSSNSSVYPPPPGQAPPGPTMVGSTWPMPSAGPYYGGGQQGPPWNGQQQWQHNMAQGSPYGHVQSNQGNNFKPDTGVVAKSAGGSCLGVCLGCFAACCCLDMLF